MSSKNNSSKLGSEPIGKLLRDLSIPAMIGMFVMALYNVIDVIFISYGVGIDAVAGLTIAFPLMMIMMQFQRQLVLVEHQSFQDGSVRIERMKPIAFLERYSHSF